VCVAFRRGCLVLLKEEKACSPLLTMDSTGSSSGKPEKKDKKDKKEKKDKSEKKDKKDKKDVAPTAADAPAPAPSAAVPVVAAATAAAATSAAPADTGSEATSEATGVAEEEEPSIVDVIVDQIKDLLVDEEEEEKKAQEKAKVQNGPCITVQIHNATGLMDAQVFGAQVPLATQTCHQQGRRSHVAGLLLQDPYIQVSFADVTEKSEYVWGGGTEPVWGEEKEEILVLPINKGAKAQGTGAFRCTLFGTQRPTLTAPAPRSAWRSGHGRRGHGPD
jgi:hypothetical protein